MAEPFWDNNCTWYLTSLSSLLSISIWLTPLIVEQWCDPIRSRLMLSKSLPYEKFLKFVYSYSRQIFHCSYAPNDCIPVWYQYFHFGCGAILQNGLLRKLLDPISCQIYVGSKTLHHVSVRTLYWIRLSSYNRLRAAISTTTLNDIRIIVHWFVFDEWRSLSSSNHSF